MEQTPFSCKYSPNLPDLLSSLSCTIAISTYQAGKVVLLSGADKGKLIQLPRSFVKAMGIAIEGDRMAIACKDEVVLLKNSTSLAQHYPKKPGVYDGMFMPRVTYHTGTLDVHDLDFCNDGLYAVNTNFSCIIKVDENHSFTPVWKPNFINKITAGDHCHLNGMAVEHGSIRYVTAFAETDSPRAWTKSLTESGVVIDYASGDVMTRGLGMPHSPRVYKDNLYLLLSATGELVRIDKETGSAETIVNLGGFVRGLAFYKDFAFIGLSKIRTSSSSFGHLSFPQATNHAGVAVVDLNSGNIIGKVVYETSVEEIYDVQILPNLRRPSILNTMTDAYKMGIDIPNRTFWGRAKS